MPSSATATLGIERNAGRSSAVAAFSTSQASRTFSRTATCRIGNGERAHRLRKIREDRRPHDEARLLLAIAAPLRAQPRSLAATMELEAAERVVQERVRAAGAAHLDLVEVARRALLERKLRRRAARELRRIVDEADPRELVEVTALAGDHEADGHALGRLRARALMPVVMALELEPVFPDQGAAARVLADEPLRELEHRDAREAARLALVADGRRTERRVLRELAPDALEALGDSVAEARLVDLRDRVGLVVAPAEVEVRRRRRRRSRGRASSPGRKSSRPGSDGPRRRAAPAAGARRRRWSSASSPASERRARDPEVHARLDVAHRHLRREPAVVRVQSRPVVVRDLIEQRLSRGVVVVEA